MDPSRAEETTDIWGLLMHSDGSLLGGRKSSKAPPRKKNQLPAWLTAGKRGDGCCCSSWGSYSHKDVPKALGEQGGESGRVRTGRVALRVLLWWTPAPSAAVTLPFLKLQSLVTNLDGISSLTSISCPGCWSRLSSLCFFPRARQETDWKLVESWGEMKKKYDPPRKGIS